MFHYNYRNSRVSYRIYQKYFFLGYFNAGFLEPYFWLGTLKRIKKEKNYDRKTLSSSCTTATTMSIFYDSHFRYYKSKRGILRVLQY